MNVAKTTLTSSEVAGTLFMHPDEIHSHLTDMVTRGLYPSEKIKPRGAMHLTINELCKFGIHAELDAPQIDALIERWAAKHQDEVKAYIRAERKARRVAPPPPPRRSHKHDQVIQLMFRDRPMMMDVLRAPHGHDASRMGMRRIGDAVLIGTSTPHIKALASFAGVTSADFCAALKSLPSTERRGSKRFATHASRAYAVKVAELLEIIDGED